MVPTDEDKQCMGQVHTAIVEKIISNAHQRIHCWHKVDCGYILRMKTKKKTGVDGIFVEDCKDWFYSFTIDIDTAKKEAMYSKYFGTWLDQQEEFITKALFEFTKWFWTKSFTENLYFLCFRHFKSLPGSDNRSTSFCESGNSALKRDTMGPKPNQPIDTSQIAIPEHEQ